MTCRQVSIADGGLTSVRCVRRAKCASIERTIRICVGPHRTVNEFPPTDLTRPVPRPHWREARVHPLCYARLTKIMVHMVVPQRARQPRCHRPMQLPVEAPWLRCQPPDASSRATSAPKSTGWCPQLLRPVACVFASTTGRYSAPLDHRRLSAGTWPLLLANALQMRRLTPLV